MASVEWLIKYYRKRAGLTQGDLANRTGYAKSTIQAIEQEKRPISSRAQLEKLIDSLEVTEAEAEELRGAWEQTFRHKNPLPDVSEPAYSDSLTQDSAQTNDAPQEPEPESPAPPLLTAWEREMQRLVGMMAHERRERPPYAELVMRSVMLLLIAIGLAASLYFAPPVTAAIPRVSLRKADVAGWLIADIWTAHSVHAIGVIDPRTGDSRPLWPSTQEWQNPTISPNYTQYQAPVFSATTHQLAFLANRASGGMDIFTVALQFSADGWPEVSATPHVIMTDCPDCKGNLVWSPDGRWLLFVRPQGIFAVSPATGQQRHITDHFNDDWPACSPDGEWLAYQGPQRTVVVVPAADCLPKYPDFTGARFVDGVSYAWDPRWSRDGSLLLFTSNIRSGWLEYAVPFSSLANRFAPDVASPYYPVGSAPCGYAVWAEQANTHNQMRVFECRFNLHTPRSHGGLLIMPDDAGPAWEAILDGGVRDWDHVGWIAPKDLAAPPTS